MSAGELQLIYTPDDEWLGQITAIARSAAFSGRGSAWFDHANVRKTFITSLRSFPFTSENYPKIEGGFGVRNREGLAQCHLRIAIKPFNSRGTLLVHVDLASESSKSPDADQQNSATVRFLTEYAAVDAFAKDLEHVLDGSKERAVLKEIVNKRLL
jgi:hypothetical protein